MIIEDLDIIQEKCIEFQKIPTGTVFRGSAECISIPFGVYIKVDHNYIYGFTNEKIYVVRTLAEAISNYKPLTAKLTIRNK